MLYLEFMPLDKPTQLSKVGNWVITFLSSTDDAVHMLAITNVIPRQVNQEIQIRRLIIQETQIEHQWEVLKAEAFNGQLNKELTLNLQDNSTQNLIFNILKEFDKYDVSIHLISSF